MAGNSTRLSRLLLAYETYDAAWRKRRGLTGNERLVIRLLCDGGPISPKGLSELVGVTTAGMTGLLGRLEAERYVTRQRHPDDGRWVLVAPTKRALRAHDELQQLFERVLEEHAVTAGQAGVISDFLDHVTECLSRPARD